jgi:hypothetical protein
MKRSLRKLAGLVLLVGAVLIGGKLLGAFQSGPVPIEIHYLLGDPPVAAALEVVAAREGGGPAVGRFETTLVGPDVKQATRLPGGRQTLDITLVSAAGGRHTVQRTLDVERGAVVRIDLSREHP